MVTPFGLMFESRSQYPVTYSFSTLNATYILRLNRANAETVGDADELEMKMESMPSRVLGPTAWAGS